MSHFKDTNENDDFSIEGPTGLERHEDYFELSFFIREWIFQGTTHLKVLGWVKYGQTQTSV